MSNETKAPAKWAQPSQVSTLNTAFGTLRGLLPAMHEIPEDFRDMNARTKWHRMQAQWMFNGLKGDRWTAKPGVDGPTALRHLATIQRSFEPKHEHKVAAVAWLASLWFDDVTYEGQRA